MLHNLSATLFSEYRRRTLGLLLMHPEESYHVREIARLTNTAPGTLHKELTRLAAAGILTRERRGNQLLYRANRACPIFDELAGIMRKTSGLADILVQALAPISTQIEVAFVYGSMARGQEIAASDIDVILIGSLSFAEAVKRLYPAQASLGREINPKVFSLEEWQRHRQERDAFLQNVLSNPKVFLVGSEYDLAKLGGP